MENELFVQIVLHIPMIASRQPIGNEQKKYI